MHNKESITNQITPDNDISSSTPLSFTSKESLAVTDSFDLLSGTRKLEILAFILEKLENGEININGKQVTSEEIGIDDAFNCCSSILDLILSENTK